MADSSREDNAEPVEESRGVVGVGWRPKMLRFQPPEVYSVHAGRIVSVMPFGAFVRIEACNRDGLVHVTQIRHATEGERIETSAEIVEGQEVWVKVIDISWRKERYFMSMKYVNQETGEDLDPGHEGIESEKAQAFEAKASKEAATSDLPAAKPGATKSPKQKKKKEEKKDEQPKKKDEQSKKKEAGAPVEGELSTATGMTISAEASTTLVAQLAHSETLRVAAALVSSTASNTRTKDKVIAAYKAATRKPKGDEEPPPNPRQTQREQEFRAYKKSLENLRVAGVCGALHTAMKKELTSAVLVAVTEAIRDCACYPEFRTDFGDIGVCETLGECLGRENLGIKTKLALLQAVRNMAFEDPKNRERLGAAGVCEKVTNLLSSSEESNRKTFAAAAQSVRDLCRDSSENRARFVDNGACKRLTILLSGEFTEGVGVSEAAKNALGAETKVAILQAVRYLAYDFARGREQFGDDGACEAIAKVFDAAVPQPNFAPQWNVLSDCAQAISYLAYNHDGNRAKLVRLCHDRIKLLARDKVPAFVRPKLEHANRMLQLKSQETK